MSLVNKPGNKTVRGKYLEREDFSSHALGTAIDIDPSENGYQAGRGTIPDQVVMALVESGFAWGNVHDAVHHPKLGEDPMHFQLRLDPRSAEAQAILDANPIGRQYWDAYNLDDVA